MQRLTRHNSTPTLGLIANRPRPFVLDGRLREGPRVGGVFLFLGVP
jgi:hypothetical protein